MQVLNQAVWVYSNTLHPCSPLLTACLSQASAHHSSRLCIPSHPKAYLACSAVCVLRTVLGSKKRLLSTSISRSCSDICVHSHLADVVHSAC